MSGGYLDYICFKLENITDRIDDRWQSGDYGRNSYDKKLKEFKAKWFGDNRNDRLKDYLSTALDEVKAEIIKLL